MADELAVFRERDGDDWVIVERGPRGIKREVARMPVGAREAAGLSMLNWHVERLATEHKATYERLLENRPTLDAYQLIGIVGYIKRGAPWRLVAKLAGIPPGQMEI